MAQKFHSVSTNSRKTMVPELREAVHKGGGSAARASG